MPACASPSLFPIALTDSLVAPALASVVHRRGAPLSLSWLSAAPLALGRRRRPPCTYNRHLCIAAWGVGSGSHAEPCARHWAGRMAMAVRCGASQKRHSRKPTFDSCCHRPPLLCFVNAGSGCSRRRATALCVYVSPPRLQLWPALGDQRTAASRRPQAGRKQEPPRLRRMTKRKTDSVAHCLFASLSLPLPLSLSIGETAAASLPLILTTHRGEQNGQSGASGAQTSLG